ncbi:hypothetical protein [Actinoplanes regularis]|uniref:hypothetical protein n=1 Tax=Actinoplanes regularis TaxID=52697 RepID=UPI0024A0212F|nr:hypothetical protein [Actinoplanes regularis]GLW29721.1 hypothetical protein Areg01_26610 [Actinoplanes regularis]
MTSDLLAELIGGQRRPHSLPSRLEEPVLPRAARHRDGPPLRIRRRAANDGLPFWRWDCENCGEYGGGRHHSDAVNRAVRHCREHPEHRSSLLPPVGCRQPETYLPLHPMLFAVDDDPPPEPLNI